MRRPIVSAGVVLAVVFVGIACSPAVAQGGKADYERALSRRPGQQAPSGQIRAIPIDGTSSFWYRRDSAAGARGREWFLVDADASTRRPLFDPARVGVALAAQGAAPAAAPRGADELQITPLQVRKDETVVLRIGGGGGGGKDTTAWIWNEADGTLRRASADEVAGLGGESRLTRRPRRTERNGDETALVFVNQLGEDVSIFWVAADGERRPYGSVKSGATREQHTFAGHAWVVVGADGRDIGFTEGGDLPTTITIGAVADETPQRAPEDQARRARPSPGVSPDGKLRAVVRESNIVLSVVEGQDADAGAALTSDGVAAEGYSGPLYWSPDSRFLVAIRRRAGDDRRVTYVQSSPRDQLQPVVKSYPYLKPGDAIPQESVGLFDVVARKQIPISTELFSNPWDIRDVHWAADSSRCYFVYNQRGHTVMRLLAVAASDGKVTPIINEECRTFFDYSSKFFLRYLDDTNEIVWMSERDGWNHLYLVDARTGAVKNQITKGEWVVRAVDRIDEQKREVWFRAMGIVPGQDPYHVHYARVGLDGTGLTVLTSGDGTHRIEYSPDGRQFIDSYSRVDLPPVTELRRTADGSLVLTLEGDPQASSTSPGLSLPERFVAKGRDGVTDIWGIIHRPSNFDPARKYPVIEQIYAGPHDQHVPKSFRADWGYPSQLAELGFIVVQIDGMGTNWRSKAFHDVAWKNLKDAGFPDRIAWMKAAAAKHPEMDLDNHGRGVGIYGGSAGGQNAMAALIWHGEFYKAAVADCGCHDNRMDKIWWNELWMSWPVGPEYEACSNVVNAHLMPRDCKLMLFVGEMDENVDPASTMQVANALVKADRDFDLVVMPNTGHGSAESPYGRRRRMDFFVRYLMGVEPRW